MSDFIITVIIPVYNEERYIEGCLSSLSHQTFPVDQIECLLIDGKSTDKTLLLAEKYRDLIPRLKIIVNDERKTPCALNLGIQKASGKYILRLDAHAIFPSEYIEKCVFYLENTDADNVGGFAITNGKGYVGTAIAKMLSSRFGVGSSEFRIQGVSGYVDTVPFGAFRREIFDKVGLFDTELLRSEDNDINARIRAVGGKIYLADDINFTYYCRNTVKEVLIMALKNGNALFRTLCRNPRAMSIRHFIPFAFLLSLLFLPWLSHSSDMCKFLLTCEIGIYCFLDLYFSCKEIKYLPVLLWLYPFFHISYGMGSLLGLLGIALY